MRFNSKQEMLHILTIAVGQIINACIRNLKEMSTITKRNKQLLEFFDNVLSKFQYGFRKDYGTQHCLLLMPEIWKGATSSNKIF